MESTCLHKVGSITLLGHETKMNKRTLISVVIAGLALCARESVAQATCASSYISFSLYGKNYQQVLSNNDFKDCPAWVPDSGPCPLPLYKAIELARAYLLSRFNSSKTWAWDGGASINRFPNGKWYYMVSLDDNKPDRLSDVSDVLRANQVSVIVCLNGHIPEITENEITPQHGDAPNTHSPSAQGVGGRRRSAQVRRVTS